MPAVNASYVEHDQHMDLSKRIFGALSSYLKCAHGSL